MKEKTKNFKKLLAFTLAEVLITLSILGVVAAITVPSLIKRQHRNEIETKLKKFVSTMENVIDTSQAENGPARTWQVTSIPAGSNEPGELFKKYILPYLNISQDNFGKTPSWYLTDPNGNTRGWGNGATAYCLKSGECFSFGFDRSIGDEGGEYQLLHLTVDFNGPKGPNALGKDAFLFHIIETGGLGSSSFQVVGYYQTYPSRVSKAEQSCKSGDGVMCAAWIKNNKWKIPSNYPWL